jgi:hypothetical protein
MRMMRTIVRQECKRETAWVNHWEVRGRKERVLLREKPPGRLYINMKIAKQSTLILFE